MRSYGEFLGVDHIDLRVPSFGETESFYDQLLPALGLTQKRYAFVDARGEWSDVPPGSAPNVAEYYESAAQAAPHFIGIIEAQGMVATQTRVAFRVAASDLTAWQGRLRAMGARNVEPSSDPEMYPAVFFEDPCGTKLELCARKR